jgi:hypothetical protein
VEGILVGKQVCKLVVGMLVEGMLAYKLVVGTQVHMVQGKQVCMLEAGKLACILEVGKLACTLEAGKQVCILVEGKQVCMLEAGKQAGMVVVSKAVEKQAGRAVHIQVLGRSSDCRSTPPTGLPSCIKKATRQIFPVVFAFKDSFYRLRLWFFSIFREQIDGVVQRL